MFRITGLLEAVVFHIFLALKTKQKKRCCDKGFLLIPRHLEESSNSKIHTETWEDLNTCRLAAVRLLLLPPCQAWWAPSHWYTQGFDTSHKDKERKGVQVLSLWEGFLPVLLSVGYLQHFRVMEALSGSVGWRSSSLTFQLKKGYCQYIESSFKTLQGQRCLSEQLFMCCITILVKKGF